MGWNEGYTIFEATVIGAYDLGKLDPELLDVLAEPYRGTDIDSGGVVGLMTKDGKDLRQVILDTLGVAMPARPSKPEPVYQRGAKRDPDAAAEWNVYYQAIGEAVDEITRQRWGWR